jgi:hypothetical protein
LLSDVKNVKLMIANDERINEILTGLEATLSSTWEGFKLTAPSANFQQASDYLDSMI